VRKRKRKKRKREKVKVKRKCFRMKARKKSKKYCELYNGGQKRKKERK
jgi:hypothetical protein